MAFAHVQASTTVAGSGTSAVISLSGTGAGNLVVVHVYMGSTTQTVSSITDDAGNTYVVGSRQNASGGTHSATQGYGVQTSGGATTITVNFSGSVSHEVGADEFSGGATSNVAVFDETLSAANSGTALAVATLTPTQAGNLVVATLVTGSARNFTAGADYTLSLPATGVQVCSQYRLSATTSETAPATISSSTVWMEWATSFNPPPTTNIKTLDGLAYASTKTVNGLAIASVKSVNGLT